MVVSVGLSKKNFLLAVVVALQCLTLNPRLGYNSRISYRRNIRSAIIAIWIRFARKGAPNEKGIAGL